MNDIEKIQEEITKKKREVEALKIKLKEATADKIYCESCQRYFEEKSITKGQYIDTIYGACVYTDSGYGDGDEFADVTYLHTVRRCPRCGKELYHNRTLIKEENHRKRR